MIFDIYQVDAFAERAFKGNPAAVMPLEDFPDDALMQSLALENNLSETAFVVRNEARGEGHYKLRWFTPLVEVDLCGHATLASAYVIWTYLGDEAVELTFETRSGDLLVTRDASGLIEMSFPANAPVSEIAAQRFEELLGVKPLTVFADTHVMAILPTAADVRNLSFDISGIASVVAPRKAALIVTATGDGDTDCVSRYFAPYAGIPEDPVTGSIHTAIVPYWAGQLGKNDIVAEQASSRGGMLWCSCEGDRVLIRGHCTSYMVGTVEIGPLA